MSPTVRCLVALCVLPLAGVGAWFAFRPTDTPAPRGEALTEPDRLDQRFSSQVRPFLDRYCVACHGTKKQEASLDLSRVSEQDVRQWEMVLERLTAEEMPPEEASRRPTPDERAAVIAWIRDLRDNEAQRNAGDPGTVLARRLSNAELDYTIRDLTGVDIRPTREFPVDPANEAGFDNSGESLAMSQALLKKYLAAARLVADHVVLLPEGLVFAPHPVVTDTDRDKYCVHRIVDFYKQHAPDLADYFLAAWKYRHRGRLGRAEAELKEFAAEAGLSAKYLAMLWPVLKAEAEAGPLAVVTTLWRQLPDRAEEARPACERMRDLVVRLRRQLTAKIDRLQVKGISNGSQPFVLWHNRQLASRHRSYAGEVFPDLGKLAEQVKDADLAKLLTARQADAAIEQHMRRALERFCSVFPSAFFVADRGPYYNPKEAGKGRLLTAGFHLMQGYFRDDEPLCELILNERQRQELDELWQELDFVTGVPMRQYKDFIFFERAEPPRFMYGPEFDFARSEDKDATSEAKMTRLATAHLAKARDLKASEKALAAIETYYAETSAAIRRVERSRRAAEPGHVEALVAFAERAYRRPLSPGEGDEVRAVYRKLRGQGEVSHEEAVRDTLVTVLLSPHFCYRIDLARPGPAAQPLSDHALASRLSYFLWSSMPDAELLAHAAAGDLHKLEVLRGQVRRMLRDPRVRGWATEFAGNWLDFRRFEEHNSVDRDRFPSFTPELRQALFEEPIRFFLGVAREDRPVLDFLYARHTWVNPSLARHYGMPFPGRPGEPSRAAAPPTDGWSRVEDAERYGRGGLLPMAVFLTKNSPGLRTSPVKRGYWVVRRLLGEQIPPPPPTVPELPKDEASLGELTLPQLLARHRADRSCAGCHRRFDSVGLVFEEFGPVGERRTKDLGGRAVQTEAVFPDGRERKGVEGLRQYLREKRQEDFVENLCRKMLSYALGRSLVLSDKQALAEMRRRLAGGGYTLGSLVEAVVTTPQFLNKRGLDDPRGE